MQEDEQQHCKCCQQAQNEIKRLEKEVPVFVNYYIIIYLKMQLVERK